MLLTIAQIGLAGSFLIFASGQIFRRADMGTYINSMVGVGQRVGEFLSVLSAVAFVAGSVTLTLDPLDIGQGWGAIILAVTVGAITLSMHRFWKLEDESEFFKWFVNLSLIFALLATASASGM